MSTTFRLIHIRLLEIGTGIEHMSIVKKVYGFFESMFRCEDETEHHMDTLEWKDDNPPLPCKLSTVVRVPGVPSIHVRFLDKDEGEYLKDDLMFEYEDENIYCYGFIAEVINNDDVISTYSSGYVDYDTLMRVVDVVRKKMIRVNEEGRMIYVDGEWCYLSPDFYFETSKWGKN